MESDPVFEDLPRAYSLALRLHAAGVDEQLIADCLGVEPEAVTPLLAVAATKFDGVTDH